MSHTKGPWKIGAVNGGWDGVYPEEGKTAICALVENNPANAVLIAAAPELLEALKALVHDGQKQGWNDKYEHDMDQARVAITRAEGKG